MRIRDTAKPKADVSTTYASHAQMVSRHCRTGYAPMRPAFPPIRLVSIGCRAVCAVVTGFACGCGTCRRLAGWVFVILVSGDRYAQIRSCRCRSTLSCVCALVHTPPSKPRDQKKCDTHWSSPRVLSTTKGLGIYRLHGNRVVSVSHCVCGHG